MFAQVLGLDQVGVEDSFFDLGGHSLLAAVLVARLAERLGIKISLRTFMSNPTVRAIDGYLDRSPDGLADMLEASTNEHDRRHSCARYAVAS